MLLGCVRDDQTTIETQQQITGEQQGEISAEEYFKDLKTQLVTFDRLENDSPVNDLLKSALQDNFSAQQRSSRSNALGGNGPLQVPKGLQLSRYGIEKNQMPGYVSYTIPVIPQAGDNPGIIQNLVVEKTDTREAVYLFYYTKASKKVRAVKKISYQNLVETVPKQTNRSNRFRFCVKIVTPPTSCACRPRHSFGDRGKCRCPSGPKRQQVQQICTVIEDEPENPWKEDSPLPKPGNGRDVFGNGFPGGASPTGGDLAKGEDDNEVTEPEKKPEERPKDDYDPIKFIQEGGNKWMCLVTASGECANGNYQPVITERLLYQDPGVIAATSDDWDSLKNIVELLGVWHLSKTEQRWLVRYPKARDAIEQFLEANLESHTNEPPRVFTVFPPFQTKVSQFVQELLKELINGSFKTSEVVDMEGVEPIKPFTGTIAVFKELLDNSPNKVGIYKGEEAEKYLIELSRTKFSYKQLRPIPTETGYFNLKKGRYIYTKKGGWIDMVHFLFYASKAYNYKKQRIKNPIGEAVQDGYKQEFTDSFVSSYSAYSYEDLPSDKYGAVFGAKHFNPNSDKTFSEQLKNYFDDILKATDAKNAPNYNTLPISTPSKKPTIVNYTTTPIFTIE